MMERIRETGARDEGVDWGSVWQGGRGCLANAVKRELTFVIKGFYDCIRSMSIMHSVHKLMAKSALLP